MSNICETLCVKGCDGCNVHGAEQTVVNEYTAPCPFCENRGDVQCVTFDVENVSVVCNNCNCMGPAGRNDATAIMLWNHRSSFVK